MAHNFKTKRIILIIIAIGAILMFCLAVYIFSSELIKQDKQQREFDQLLEGVPADPETYQLIDIGCAKQPDRLDLEVSLYNPTSIVQHFSLALKAVKTNGEEEITKSLVSNLEPGETREVSTWFASPESYPESADCQVEIFKSPVPDSSDQE